MRLTKIAARGFALLCAPLLTWSAQATVVTVASDISNIFMGTASNTTGTFNINSSAAALGFNSPMNVTSASLSFLFSDNIDPYQTASGFVSSTLVRLPDTCGSTLGSCVQNYYWADRYVTSNYDPFETARVTVGAQSASASSTYYQSTVGPYLQAQGQTNCNAFGCGFVPITRRNCGQFLGSTFCDGPWPVYNENVTRYQIYDGAFSLTLNLDATSLLDLGSDGLLSFSLGAFAGDFNFLSASLTADIYVRDVVVDPIDPIDPGPPVAVPEPTAPALLIAGLLLIAVHRKARWTHS